MFIQLARICVLSWLYAMVHANQNPEISLQKRVPKQIHTKGAVLEAEEDNNPAETHLGAEAAAAAGHHGHGKYFMDTIMIQTGPKQLEFGHVCENPHEWEQRYERQDQDNRRYQGKARWGDKHGGYGEHYWDYNHGGHDDKDEGSDDDEGDGSHPVPEYQVTDDQDDRVKREPQGGRVRRPRPRPSTTAAPDHVEDSGAPPEEDAVDQSSSGAPPPAAPDHPGLRLAYDVESGTVVDEETGRRFLLTPIN